jgi:MFS family permease
VGFVQAGWPVGAILIGILASRWIPEHGWRFGFKVASIFSFCVSMIVMLLMEDRFVKQVVIQKESKFQLLFSQEYKSSTIRIWIAAFFGFMTLYTVMSWVPTIASDAGLPFALATYVGIVLNIGAAMGSSSIGWIGSKLGLQKTQFTFMMIAFLLMIGYAFVPSHFILILVLIGLLGIFVQGGFNGIWPILARLYPMYFRSTGIGWAVGVGRIGAIIGPALFGIFSDMHFSTKVQFIVFSIPLVIMGFLVITITIKKD